MDKIFKTKQTAVWSYLKMRSSISSIIPQPTQSAQSKSTVSGTDADAVLNILGAIQKAKLTPQQIGALATIASMLSSSGAIKEDDEVEEEVESEEVEPIPTIEAKAEPIAEADEEVEEDEEKEEDVLDFASATQYPALPKSTRAPSPIRDPKKAAAIEPVTAEEEECSHDECSDEDRPAFSNEPEECWHFYNGKAGCNFGAGCFKWHGHLTRKGRRISARTADQIDAGTIICFRCQEEGHHVDDCQCGHCGSERHITVKCPRCYNCGAFGHINRKCPEEPREPRERVVYGTPNNWKY